MADDSLWKPLNYQILLKTRDSSPKVRFAALITVLALAEKLSENYIVLLPESILFLAELMEEECEEVQHQCQKTIQQLETILGEPLQSYSETLGLGISYSVQRSDCFFISLFWVFRTMLLLVP